MDPRIGYRGANQGVRCAPSLVGALLMLAACAAQSLIQVTARALPWGAKFRLRPEACTDRTARKSRDLAQEAARPIEDRLRAMPRAEIVDAARTVLSSQIALMLSNAQDASARVIVQGNATLSAGGLCAAGAESFVLKSVTDDAIARLAERAFGLDTARARPGVELKTMTGPTLQHLLMGAALAVSIVALGPIPQAFAQTASTGAFRDLSSIEASLLRSVTTKVEVRKQLGIANGSGGARFAVLGGEELEIWYCEDIELTGAKLANQLMKIDMRQQILLVIFKGQLVDGYLWTSNAGTGSVR